MQIYGHRGAAGEAPENTIAGCRHAIQRGVDRIEVDLQLSADGKIVIVHDTTVNRTTGQRGKVAQFSARELYAMDARAGGPAWSSKKQTGIPTLDKLLASTPELKKYQLEVKPGPVATMRNIAQQLAERFAKKKDAKRIIITSSNTKLLAFVQEFAPHLETGLVATRKTDVAVAKHLQVNYFCSQWKLCTAALVRKAQANGQHVSCWTVNDPTTVRALYAMGVDSIITDYPSMALPLISSLPRRDA